MRMYLSYPIASYTTRYNKKYCSINPKTGRQMELKRQFNIISICTLKLCIQLTYIYIQIYTSKHIYVFVYICIYNINSSVNGSGIKTLK